MATNQTQGKVVLEGEFYTEPPIWSHPAEQAVLATVLREPSTYAHMADLIGPADFHWECFAWVWEAMGRLFADGKIIDCVTLADELGRENKLDEFRLPVELVENLGHTVIFQGRAALSELRDLPTTESGESYALIVQDYAAKRKIDRWLTEAHTWAHNGRPAHAIISDLETSFAKLILHSGKIRSHTLDAEASAFLALQASQRASEGERCFPTGLIDLDKLLAPQKAELITIAASTGQGKSALCGTIALNAARKGKRILFFTVEMSVIQVTQRLIAQLTGLNSFNIMRGELQPEEWDTYSRGVEEYNPLQITICDMPSIKISQIRTEARAGEWDAIFLDYVQLANSDKKNDRRDLDIGEVTSGMKGLAKELDVPVFEAAQLSRATETHADRRPQLSDLRESGSIENDSDSVVFIYHPKDLKNIANLIVAKHRQGPIGELDVVFLPETARFVDATIRHIDLDDGRLPYKD